MSVYDRIEPECQIIQRLTTFNLRLRNWAVDVSSLMSKIDEKRNKLQHGVGEKMYEKPEFYFADQNEI